jgi:hypothetical protein
VRYRNQSPIGYDWMKMKIPHVHVLTCLVHDQYTLSVLLFEPYSSGALQLHAVFWIWSSTCGLILFWSWSIMINVISMQLQPLLLQPLSSSVLLPFLTLLHCIVICMAENSETVVKHPEFYHDGQMVVFKVCQIWLCQQQCHTSDLG